MIDIPSHIEAIHREVAKRTVDGGDVIAVVLGRTYPAAIEDVWSALTDPERIERWFMPVSGDLQPGGNFQLEGNAGGEILECQPPSYLEVTFGGPTSVVVLRLSPDGDEATALELEHTVPIEMAGSVAGALYVGPGWDGAFMALDLFLRGEVADDPVAAADSPEAREFSQESVRVWRGVVESSGSATDDEITVATEASLAQFAPDDN